MLFYRKNKVLVETRGLLFINKCCKNKRLFKRFYFSSNIKLGKDKKIIKFIGVIGTSIKNVLKNGVKNELISKNEKILGHKGIQIKQYFIDEKGTYGTGFMILTTKNDHSIKDYLGSNLSIETLTLDKKQKMSKGIAIVKNSDIDNNLLEGSIDLQMTEKYLEKAQNEFDKFIKSNKGIILTYKDVVKDQKLYKTKIDKINKEGNIIISDLHKFDKSDKINKID